MCVIANKLSLFFLQSCIYSKKYVSEKFIDAVSTHVLGIHDKNSNRNQTFKSKTFLNYLTKPIHIFLHSFFSHWNTYATDQ